MNKFKKLIVVALSLVMALALAIPSFADEASAKSKLKAYMASYGIDASVAIDALTPAQIDEIKSKQSSLESLVSGTYEAVKANPANAQALVDSAVAQAGVSGVSVSKVTVTVSGGKVVATADIAANGKTATASATVATPVAVAADDHGDIGPAIANGTWGKDDSKPASSSAAVTANPLTASSNAVIKATGDNSAVVVVAAVLAVVAVLGLGFRKNNSMSVA